MNVLDYGKQRCDDAADKWSLVITASFRYHESSI